jgi:hypothetical protein
MKDVKDESDNSGDTLKEIGVEIRLHYLFQKIIPLTLHSACTTVSNGDRTESRK